MGARPELFFRTVDSLGRPWDPSGMATTTKAKAVSYLRVSGAGQVEGDGFTRQRAACEGYAKRAGLELVEEFRDEGVSGTRDLDSRPGLAALLDRVESNGVRVVLVEAAHRLARDLMVSEVILAQFREAGVQVIEAESGVELTVGDDDPTRKLIRQVLAAVAEFDKSTLVHKLRAARTRKRAREGRCEGRKPFGARAGEPETLELMRSLYRKPRGGERRTFAEIARELDERGRPTRTGAPWSRAAVAKILTREGVTK